MVPRYLFTLLEIKTKSFTAEIALASPRPPRPHTPRSQHHSSEAAFTHWFTPRHKQCMMSIRSMKKEKPGSKTSGFRGLACSNQSGARGAASVNHVHAVGPCCAQLQSQQGSRDVAVGTCQNLANHSQSPRPSQSTAIQPRRTHCKAKHSCELQREGRERKHVKRKRQVPKRKKHQQQGYAFL